MGYTLVGPIGHISRYQKVEGLGADLRELALSNGGSSSLKARVVSASVQGGPPPDGCRAAAPRR